MAQIGMVYPVFAPISSISGSTITYGTGVVIGRAVAGSLQWTRDDAVLYGDDAVAESDNTATGYTLDITTTELPEDVETVILGTVKSGGEYSEYNDPGPDGGMGYVQVLKRNGTLLYRGVWYPKISFARTSEESNTKGQSISWGTPQIHGTGMGVFDSTSGKTLLRKKQVFSSAASAIAWLKTLANIT